MSKVYAYLRVSTSRQDTENQKIEIEKYCQQHGLTIDDTIAIEISSRKDMKDRHIDELMSRLKRNDTLIVSELSRLGRSIKELHIIIDQLLRKKITFHAVKQSMRINGKLTLEQKVLVSMFSLFAELERDLISARTKNGLARAKAAGKILGNPNLPRDNKVRFDNAMRFAEGLRPTFTAYIENGFTQRQIALELNNLGVKTRQGGEWALAQVQRVLNKLNLKTSTTK